MQHKIDNEKILKVISKSLNMDAARIDLYFHNQSKEVAEVLIADIAKELGRSYRHSESYNEDVGIIEWYEIDSRDDDNIEVTIFIKKDELLN